MGNDTSAMLFHSCLLHPNAGRERGWNALANVFFFKVWILKALRLLDHVEGIGKLDKSALHRKSSTMIQQVKLICLQQLFNLDLLGKVVILNQRCVSGNHLGCLFELYIPRLQPRVNKLTCAHTCACTRPPTHFNN